MDLYEQKEHVISSDEYSDDDDADDALMNDAVRAQDRSSDYAYRNKQPLWGVDQKQKELSSLIRRNKISVIYKNKSIKWLNNKRQRERYKERIYLETQKNVGQMTSITAISLKQDEQKTKNNKSTDENFDKLHSQDIVSIEDDDIDSINIYNNKEVIKKNEVLQTISTIKYSPGVVNTQLEQNREVAHEKPTTQEENIKHIVELRPSNEKTIELTAKRTRSQSPPILNETTEADTKQSEKRFRAISPQFYKSINDMFPKFDKIASNHVENIASTSLTVTEEKIKQLSNEIKTLNEILQTKEMEWNRLLHLKMVKEEIYSRLNKKRHILQLKESFLKKQDHNILVELKELEFYLSEKKPNSPETNHSSMTIQKLIENRANMNADDLKREKNNTSRLHSLLVSQNMLHAADSIDNSSPMSNGEQTNISLLGKNCDMYNHLDGGGQVYNRGRQGVVKDVKSIIADFRQKNPDLLPRVGKRIKSTETNAHHHNFSIPLFENSSSCAQYFNKDRQSEYYPLTKSADEISITPIGRVKKMTSIHDIDFNNLYNVRLEDNFLKGQVKRDFDGKCPKNIQYSLCQECKTNESRFVCAGCGNQWYCSKKCQISAWDKHSELCTE